MKRRSRVIAIGGLLLLLGCTLAPDRLGAQSEPILVTLSILPPYSPDLTVWEARPDRVLIRLQNRTAESYQVRLSGFAENLNGDTRIVTKDNYPRNRITVGPNAIVTLNLRDLQIFTADAVDFIGADRTTIARTKLLPEGSYRMCVRALEYTTLERLSPAEPSGCATFLIRLSEPPRPLMPGCGTTVQSTVPQRLIFQWSVPAGAPASTSYEFEMTEVPPGRDPNEALASKTSPIFFTRRLSAPLLSYGAAEPNLVPGRTYAWRVRASDANGGTVFSNDGYSEVCSFTWGKVTPLIGQSDGVNLDPNLGGKDIDGSTRGGLVGQEGIVRLRDLRVAEDLIAPACITLKPYLLRSGLTPKAPPRFGLEVSPAINPRAIGGGKIEIWEAVRSIQPRFFNEKKARPVFEASFTGNGSDVLRHTRLGDLSRLELTFINSDGARETFRPEPKKSYRWRVTLEFDGEKIRHDGQVCNLDQARSPFGKFPDLVAAPDLPDTLVAAGFNIVVEEWDDVSTSSDPDRPSGIGRIEFDCDAPPPVRPVPWWRGDLTLVERKFEVVDLIADSTREFSLPEARTIRESSSVGDVIGIYMPDRSSSGADREELEPLRRHAGLRTELLADRAVVLDLFGGRGLKGIRVAFRDVAWSGPVTPKVNLTDGIAVYPSPTPIPSPPATLDLENGFRLQIDSLTIEVAEARVEGHLELPPSIISTDTCTMATLPVPETVIRPWCDFYVASTDDFGRWAIGETGLEIEGNGYVLDFSSTASPSGPSPSLGNAWKGVLLRNGTTISVPSGEIVSNRGYTRAPFGFADARIEGDGFHDRLDLSSAWEFTALDPYGYLVQLETGFLEVAQSVIDTGEFRNGRIQLPRNAIARNTVGDKLFVDYGLLAVQHDMDLAALVRVDAPLVWGERSRESTRPSFYTLSQSVDSGAFWLGSHWQSHVFVPVTDTLYDTPTLLMPSTLLSGGWLESQSMGGATFPGLRERDFTVRTDDLPVKSDVLKFAASIVGGAWMHVGYNGVNAEVLLRPNATDPGPVDVGPTWSSGYLADSVPFRIILADLGGAAMPPVTTHAPEFDPRKMMRFRFVQSAVWSSDLSGVALLGGPIGMPVVFRDMMFTSSANNAGGDVYFGGDDTLDHWGLEMIGKDTAASAGVLAVKQGVIYLTAAGIAERVHFAEPFWLTWGEMKASGDFGRLFFDYNNVGQKFDDFGYATEFVALSPFVAGDSGYVQTYGSLSIPFFGAKMMSISDYRSTAIDSPYFGRFVRVLPVAHLGAGQSELRWERSWAGGLADLEFAMLYDTVAQYGFLGPGTASLLSIIGEMDAFLRMSALDACFRVIESDQRGFDIGPVASMGRIAEIWGCGCIEDGTIRQIAIGGQLSHSATSTVLQARAADHVSLVFGYSPDRTTFFANGQMFINIAGSDVDVFGLTHFIVDRAEMYAEGYFKGTVALGAVVGIPIVAGANSGISGFGEMDWHAGLDYQSMQGRVGVSMYNMVGGLGVTVGGGTSLETGIFLGINAPKNRAWVMDGIDGRFGLNKGGLPANLTGFYAYLGIKQGIDLFIVSGGYEVYVGVGAFAPSFSDPITGGIIGNVGLYIWGKILGGLVSAAAWGNLQMILAIPPAFEGSVGLEACVLWLFCGSVSVHAGFNREDGFYVY